MPCKWSGQSLDIFECVCRNASISRRYRTLGNRIRNTEAFHLKIILYSGYIQSKLHKRRQKGSDRKRQKLIIETQIANWPNAVRKKLLTQIKMKGKTCKIVQKWMPKRKSLSDLASSLTAPIQNTKISWHLDYGWCSGTIPRVFFSLVQLIAVILFMLKPLKHFVI